MKKFLLVVSFWLLVVAGLIGGCATAPKKEPVPVPAESGIGVTIWKIPIVGVGFWGWDRWWGPGVNQVIVHRYDYQVKPQSLPPETPPSPPTSQAMPAPVDYQTVYKSAWDDPTLIIFKNDSYRKLRVEINSQRPIVLESYGATADLHLGVGEHRVRLVIEKLTAAHGTLEVIRFFKIYIRPEGHSQIFYIY